jgi:hypothetical protein
MSNASNLEVITSVQRRRRWAVELRYWWQLLKNYFVVLC